MSPWLSRFIPIKCSTERLQQSFSRQDAETAKNEIPISNIEMRNNFKIRMTKIPNCLVNCFEHLHFRHYNLFRSSNFGFRASTFVCSWSPLRLCGSPRGISFPQKRYLFIHGIVSRGSPRGVLISTQAEYDPQSAIPRGKSSFIRFPKPKINGKFQICLVILQPSDLDWWPTTDCCSLL